MLSAHVPQLEVHVWHGYGGDILPDGGYSLELRVGVRGQEERFHLFVEGGFASIIETEEEDGVFCGFGC